MRGMLTDMSQLNAYVFRSLWFSCCTHPRKSYRETRMLRLPPVLRPRLTWKYIVCSTAVLYVSYCFLVDSPLFASKLPRYTGPNHVGTITIEAPTRQRVTSDFKFRSTGEPAFQLDTVLFDLYYPAVPGSSSRQPRHYWFPKPIATTAEGFLRLGRVNNVITNNVLTASLWGLAGGIQIPAKVDVPILRPEDALHTQVGDSVQRADVSKDGFPVVVFSHGFASSRTDYTHYIGELASRGYVVAAIEHRDGSSPGSAVMVKDSVLRTVFPFHVEDLEDHAELTKASLKTAALNFRQAEVEESIRVLNDINTGLGEKVYNNNPRSEGKGVRDWSGQLNMSQITIAGHSFGATLALQTLKNAPSTKLPLHGCIALDPGKSSGQLNTDINVPTMIIHSNSWSSKHSVFFGRPHFDVVKELAQSVLDKGLGSWFLTSLGTSHPSVTDAPLIEPLLLSWTTGATIDVKEGVEQYVKASEEFLHYQHTGHVSDSGLLAQNVSHQEYKDPEGDTSGLDKRFRKYWQVHVAPQHT